MARYASLIAYEDANGNLLLAQVGTAQAASGFKSGVNVQAASVMFGLDQRYSDVVAVALAVDTTLQLHPGAPPAGHGTSPLNRKDALDPSVPRYRPLVVISEQGFAGLDFTLRRAQWEVARRYGRSQTVTLVADSWRDASGKLWEPNTLAPVDIPELRLPGLLWLITQVDFIVDLQRGKVAEITLMPHEAFTLQPPVSLQDKQITQAMREAVQ
jgi:prophage tail gpP-like protein